MKTKQLHSTTNYFKLLKGLLMMTIFAFCITVVHAQCSAGYTYVVDPANNGHVNFTNTSASTTAPVYYWSFGDGGGSYVSNPTHIFTTGTYIVCLTAYDSTGVDSSGAITGCSSTFCDSIVVVNDSSAGGGTGTCTASYFVMIDSVGTGVTFTSSVSGTADTYYWTFGDGTTSTAANPYHLYPTAGTYNVCLYVSSSTDSTCNYTACGTVTTAGGGTGGCSAYFVVVQDSTNLYNYFVYNYSSAAGGMLTTYMWSFGDGTTSTLEYPSHTYATDASYDLCLTISDGTGCTSTYCDTVNPGHGAMSTMTINVINPATVGIHESEITSTFENYPNPFSENTTINYTISKDASVELNVVDLLGNKVATVENGNISSGQHSVVWNVNGVSQGMYLIQLKVNNHISTKKIIINK